MSLGLTQSQDVTVAQTCRSAGYTLAFRSSNAKSAQPQLPSHLAAVLDLVTHEIIGWTVQPKAPAMRSIVGKAAEAMHDHMRTELPLATPMMAAQRQRPATGPIGHSDRGSQYASEAYANQLTAMRPNY